MSTAKASLILIALVAGVALVQAAGGIKGQRLAESLQRPSGLKGPRLQQQFLQPQPIPQPIPQPLPQPLPQPQIQQIQPLPQAPRPTFVQQTKNAGQVTPIFTAARVQPVAPVAPVVAVAPAAPVQQIIQQQQQQEQEAEQQQQQQETEIDPNAAAQDSAAAVVAPNRAVVAVSEEEANPRPEPYSFNYGFESGDSATSGSSQREETQDASGKVTGFYTLKGEDGRDRRVDYVADASGFRATITTNEMGTAPKDSADVDWQAQSPSEGQLRAAESATQAARLRALQSPQASGSASASSTLSTSKITSPRQNALASGYQQQQVAAPSKVSPAAQQQQVQINSQQAIAQLQEPFEQIRQTELNARARRASRHAPFYLFTV